ncbi:MAG: tyrosine-type recombinase/integrase [Chloroflexota bacterium]|nr:tyrosine-type recombinase/integrase [Chloroflexota bacterium]
MLPEIVMFNKWLRRRSPHAATHVHYTNDLELFFAWVDKSPNEITLRDVDAYIEHCQTDLGHAIATVNRRLAAIRSFYHFLDVESDDAPSNPVIPKRHFIRQGRRLPRDVEDADVAQLFTVIESPRDQAIFLLMLRCGLRVGEVHNLSTGDLYLRPAPGSLPRLWVRGKNDAQRVAYLSAQALAALDRWLTVRPVVDEQAIFLNRFGQRLKVNGIQVGLARYCHKAGVWITCHQLRHTFGRHLVEARVPATTIQRLLGHARIRTTEVYLHISDRQVQADYEAAMAEIDRRLLPERGSR